ncbi:g5382 [Coccomyxa elongata]
MKAHLDWWKLPTFDHGMQAKPVITMQQLAAVSFKIQARVMEAVEPTYGLKQAHLPGMQKHEDNKTLSKVAIKTDDEDLLAALGDNGIRSMGTAEDGSGWWSLGDELDDCEDEPAQNFNDTRLKEIAVAEFRAYLKERWGIDDEKVLVPSENTAKWKNRCIAIAQDYFRHWTTKSAHAWQAWSTARSHFSALRMHFKCAFAAEGWQNIFCSVLFNRDVAQYKKELDREARSAATILQEQLQVMVEDLERELVAARFAVAAAPGKRLALAAQRRVLQETVVTKLAGERGLRAPSIREIKKGDVLLMEPLPGEVHGRVRLMMTRLKDARGTAKPYPLYFSRYGDDPRDPWASEGEGDWVWVQSRFPTSTARPVPDWLEEGVRVEFEVEFEEVELSHGQTIPIRVV